MEYDQDTRYKFNQFAPNYIATSGVMNFFEDHQAHWLGDVIASYRNTLIKKKADYLKVINMEVDVENTCGVFTISDEINGELVKQIIPYTDLTESVVMWLIEESPYEVLLFPSEY